MMLDINPAFAFDIMGEVDMAGKAFAMAAILTRSVSGETGDRLAGVVSDKDYNEIEAATMGECGFVTSRMNNLVYKAIDLEVGSWLYFNVDVGLGT